MSTIIGRPGSSIGNPPPRWAPDPLGARVLAALAQRYRQGSLGLLWSGDVRALGIKTGTIAGALGMTPGTPERQALNEALSGLRKARLLKYEYDRLVDPEVRWFLTDAGLEAGDQPAGRVP